MRNRFRDNAHVRTVGVEEELLLIDAATGQARSSADSVLLADTGNHLTGELQQEQVETGTRPSTDLSVVHAEILRLRRHAAAAAAHAGARIAALGTSPLPVSPQAAPQPRYQKMVERFGLTAAEQLTCGAHVHVGVEDDDEGIAVLDRIRVWLPTLLALSANSPYWQGRDSGYASFRSQSWSRWPSAGPTAPFGSPENYHRLVEALVASGTVLDKGMIYFDARLSGTYPTVELRTADVCRQPADAILIAALARGLVETASRQWRAGQPPNGMPTELLRVASWQAGRSGIDGALVHPGTGRPVPARAVIDDLVRQLQPALHDAEDRDLVDELLARLLVRGNGATAQRATFTRTNDLRAVALEAAEQEPDRDATPLGSLLGTRHDPGPGRPANTG